MMSRARRSLTSPAAWPEDLDDSLGASATRLYVTPEEASQLYAEIQQAWNDLFGTDHRFAERRDPKLRPADAIPVEFVLFAYPLLDLPRCPTPARPTTASRTGTVLPHRADARGCTTES
jgi:hypothetical protein